MAHGGGFVAHGGGFVAHGGGFVAHGGGFVAHGGGFVAHGGGFVAHGGGFVAHGLAARRFRSMARTRSAAVEGAGLYGRIHELVARIPRGRVATYGGIAARIGRCTPRMVGYAMAATPAGLRIPWQRVINSRGEVSPRRHGEGHRDQRALLAAEGVEFDERGRVDLARFGWPTSPTGDDGPHPLEGRARRTPAPRRPAAAPAPARRPAAKPAPRRPASIDVVAHNAAAWDAEVARRNRWTIPVDAGAIARARRGDWQILLTPTLPVPRSWFPPLHGARVLCLASGGGQQGPILAAAGARVTVYDNSPKQLAQDRRVARREGLELAAIRGDMADLGRFADGAFDLVVHPIANVFAPDLRPVWREAHRVLRPGGELLAGFTCPIVYLFDQDDYDRGRLTVRHRLPYADVRDLPADALRERLRDRRPLEFSHTLTEQIAGQLEAGFVLTGFYEDIEPEDPLSRYTPIHAATRARREPPAGR
ncbi:MAG: MGMT family protein [Candidatus Eisenbacteria bacterium]|uniref:MGMT family protein n=1 Tax=Eiseniibacteriota bacterium TaxID=2212470 RepID=A0A937XAP7_UNCEI|nr:MGMT family protein [Candidatus Eisenbacteria bacterium]